MYGHGSCFCLVSALVFYQVTGTGEYREGREPGSWARGHDATLLEREPVARQEEMGRVSCQGEKELARELLTEHEKRLWTQPSTQLWKQLWKGIVKGSGESQQKGFSPAREKHRRIAPSSGHDAAVLFLLPMALLTELAISHVQAIEHESDRPMPSHLQVIQGVIVHTIYLSPERAARKERGISPEIHSACDGDLLRPRNLSRGLVPRKQTAVEGLQDDASEVEVER